MILNLLYTNSYTNVVWKAVFKTRRPPGLWQSGLPCPAARASSDLVS